MPMNSRERVYATIDFQGPDRVARDIWLLPKAREGREDALQAVLDRYPGDIAGAPCLNPHLEIGTFHLGTYRDSWGCEWLNLVEGIVGEVKKPVFADYSSMAGYEWPSPCDEDFREMASSIEKQRDRFVLSFGGDPFERMQFLRGTENLYMDLADEECDAVYELRDRVFGFYRQLVERMVRFDVDGVSLNDDWGSQRSLLISPPRWREFFKPKYQELFDVIRNAGKRVFFHSDGYIAAIYPDLIELGASAINSQVWCMGLDTVSPFAGMVTFWGELDRQNMLPRGTPEEIREGAGKMFKAFFRNGGLIGQCEFDHLTSLANVEAALSVWETFTT